MCKKKRRLQQQPQRGSNFTIEFLRCVCVCSVCLSFSINFRNSKIVQMNWLHRQIFVCCCCCGCCISCKFQRWHSDGNVSQSVNQPSIQPMTWQPRIKCVYVGVWFTPRSNSIEWNLQCYHRAQTHGCTVHTLHKPHNIVLNERRQDNQRNCHRLCNAILRCKWMHRWFLPYTRLLICCQTPWCIVNCSFRNRFNFEIETKKKKNENNEKKTTYIKKSTDCKLQNRFNKIEAKRKFLQKCPISYASFASPTSISFLTFLRFLLSMTKANTHSENEGQKERGCATKTKSDNDTTNRATVTSILWFCAIFVLWCFAAAVVIVVVASAAAGFCCCFRDWHRVKSTSVIFIELLFMLSNAPRGQDVVWKRLHRMNQIEVVRECPRPSSKGPLPQQAALNNPWDPPKPQKKAPNRGRCSARDVFQFECNFMH